MKQVTFALAEGPRLQPAAGRTAAVAVATAPRVGSLAATKSDANNSRTPVESRVSAPDTSLPLLASCNSIVPSAAPAASPFPTASASRTYGKTSRPSAAAPEQHVTSAFTLNRASSALHSPAKTSAADDHTLASNNTPGKDNTAAAAVDAAITPSTEPRVSRGKSSGRPPAVHAGCGCVQALTSFAAALAKGGSGHSFVKGSDVISPAPAPLLALDSCFRSLHALPSARATETSARLCCAWAGSISART